MKNSILLSFGLFSVVTFTFFIFISFLFLHPSTDTIEESEKDFHRYKYLGVNTQNNERSFGFVTSSNILDEQQSVFRESGNNMYLISNFGEEEYQCFGSCYCDENEKRRNSGTGVFSKGITYLLVAMSSIVAYDLSKEYFNEKCNEEYSSNCAESSIISSVDECISVSFSEDREDEFSEDKEEVREVEEEKTQSEEKTIDLEAAGKEEEEEEEDDFKKEEGKMYYACHGKCMKRFFSKYHEDFNLIMMARDESERKCEKLTMSGVVSVVGEEILELTDDLEVLRKLNELHRTYEKRKALKDMGKDMFFFYAAVLKFRNGEMKKFCKDRSRIEIELSSISEHEGEQEFWKEPRYLCATPYPITKENIVCTKVFQ